MSHNNSSGQEEDQFTEQINHSDRFRTFFGSRKVFKLKLLSTLSWGSLMCATDDDDDLLTRKGATGIIIIE